MHHPTPALAELDPSSLEPSEERRWLDRAAELGLACSKEVFGEDFDLHLGMVVVARMAAGTVWRTAGEPDWDLLDVDVVKAELEAEGLTTMEIGDHLAVLASFCAFLLKRGALSAEAGEPLLQELFPYFAEHTGRGDAFAVSRT